MHQPAPILLVEDNDDDAFMIRRAFEKAQILNPLHLAHTGEQALAYLKGEGLFADRAQFPLPELLLLDLRLPGMDGFAVLNWLRQQPAFQQLRVVVLTSSTDVRDVNLAFQFGANGFMLKPVDFLRFAEFSDALAGCWVWMHPSHPIPQPVLSPEALAQVANSSPQPAAVQPTAP